MSTTQRRSVLTLSAQALLTKRNVWERTPAVRKMLKGGGDPKIFQGIAAMPSTQDNARPGRDLFGRFVQPDRPRAANEKDMRGAGDVLTLER